MSSAGDLALDGTLEVSLINGFTPTAGQSFDILNWGSLSGTFSSLALPTLTGLTWDTSQLYTNGVLSVASAGIPGDYNNNGTVDAADFVVWRKNRGTTNVLPNDPIGGMIGTAQYDTWRTHFGPFAGSGAVRSDGLSGNGIPEPKSLVLLILTTLMAISADNCRHR